MRFDFIILAVLFAASAMGADSATAIFERRCLNCHSDAEHKGGLSLATLALATKGGENGAAIVPGKPAAGLLLDYITGDKPEMPKSGPPLTADEVAAIKAWIAAGAAWPEGLVLKDRSLADANWWSLKPLVRPPLPTIRNPQSTIRNPLDAFITAKLAEKGLPQSPEAEPYRGVRTPTEPVISDG